MAEEQQQAGRHASREVPERSTPRLEITGKEEVDLA